MAKMDNISLMPIEEFRQLGYLQELNRQFLHPLGLALEITQEPDGTERISGVWDYRDDPEGINYGLNDPKFVSPERRSKFIAAAQFIQNEIIQRKGPRQEALGYFIEPIESL